MKYVRNVEIFQWEPKKQVYFLKMFNDVPSHLEIIFTNSIKYIYVTINVERNALPNVWKTFQEEMRITKRLIMSTKSFATQSTSHLRFKQAQPKI